MTEPQEFKPSQSAQNARNSSARSLEYFMAVLGQMATTLRDLELQKAAQLLEQAGLEIEAEIPKRAKPT